MAARKPPRKKNVQMRLSMGLGSPFGVQVCWMFVKSIVYVWLGRVQSNILAKWIGTTIVIGKLRLAKGLPGQIYWVWRIFQ